MKDSSLKTYSINLYNYLNTSYGHLRRNNYFALSYTSSGWVICKSYGYHRKNERILLDEMSLIQNNILFKEICQRLKEIDKEYGRVFIERDGNVFTKDLYKFKIKLI